MVRAEPQGNAPGRFLRRDCGAIAGERLAGLVLVVLTLCGPAGCEQAPDSTGGAGQGARPDRIESFLRDYWARPLRAQGTPPAHFSPLEAALDPRSCGACHAAQYSDWKQSLHSRAMGPGVLGQLLDMAPEATQRHQDCLRCHAPLKEQADGFVTALAGRRARELPASKDAGAPLHEHGVVCAACHLRGHRRYGPPPRQGPPPDDAAKLPHNGWASHVAFEDSRFCSACHQFEKDGYALNGKLLENTYEEWKASRHAREGRTCQSCHMPERRHLWRGIHDPEMVKSGVTIDATPASIRSGIVSAALTIKNTGTGHHFPTYVTPRVVAEAYQEDAGGRMLKDTLREFIIARQVSPDLTEELADTRLAPDETAVFEYRAPADAAAVTLVFRVRVEPDAFYMGFYRALLEGNPAGKGREWIQQALADSLASQFVLYTARHSLPK